MNLNKIKRKHVPLRKEWIVVKAKKEIRNFLMGSLIWIFVFRVVTGEKIIFDFTRFGLVLVTAIAVSVFIEYTVRKNSD